jgi:tryptophan synthase alpha chain
MSRIAAVFQNRSRKALVPYLTVGYPKLEDTAPIAHWLANNGADILELGIPFSDPLADGATIQASSYQALKNGVTPEFCLQTAAAIRKADDVPLVLMTYFNPILSYGIEHFCQDCLNAGVDGLIVPDLPPEESGLLEKASGQNDLDLIFLLSPNSTPARRELVARKSQGFIYLVSVTGVTGVRQDLPAGLPDFIHQVRGITDKPLCLGFGVSTPEQARQISALADGVIVGSRLIQLITKVPDLRQFQALFQDLRRAIDQ